MFNLLFNPQKAERHPLEMMFVGIFYSSISILLGLWIFNISASIAIVFLTVISCLYVVQGAIKMEEKKEKNYNSEKWSLAQHKNIVILFLSLFLGFVISFALWSFFLPDSVASQVFELQDISVEQVRAITGSAIDTSSPIVKIFLNNINIILISLVFALFYGAGAIYILTWNASVMGFVIGNLAKSSLGLPSMPLIFLKYFLHGIPEMLAYIVAALAGGILYFAFIKGDLIKKDRIKRILVDFITLVFISIALLVLAAVIEVYISTLL